MNQFEQLKKKLHLIDEQPIKFIENNKKDIMDLFNC